MAAQLTASFVLKLEDKLSGGIQALTRKLDDLAKLARTVQMTGLDAAEGTLAKVGAGADAAGRKLQGMGRAARGALDDIRRLGDQAIRVNSSGIGMLPPAMARAAMAGTVLAAAALSSGGGAGGAAGGGPHPPLRLPAPLRQLAAPHASFGGGIPLPPLSPFQAGYARGAGMNFPRLTAGARGLGNAVRGASGQVQGLSSEMGKLGHASLTVAATGFGLLHPIAAYAKFENILRHVAITEGLSGDAVEARIKSLTGLINQAALSAGQSGEELAHAYTFLATTPLKETKGLIDELVPIMAHAATAYNTPIGQMGQALYALSDSLKITAAEMPGALAAMAYAAKEAHFGVSDFSRDLPEIAGRMAMLGWTGRGAANSVFAGLETVVQNASIPSVAATAYKDALVYITQPIATKSFKHAGIDLPAEMKAGTAAGKNPMDAFLDVVKKLTDGIKDPVEKAFKLGTVLHNQQAGTAVISLLAHREAYEASRQKLEGVTSETLANDDETAQRAPEVKLRKLQERLEQVQRRLGEGFLPVLDRIDGALDKVLAVFTWLDGHQPGALSGILGWVGGFFALAAVLGLIGPLLGVIWGGLKLMFLPIKGAFLAIRFLGGALVSALMAISLPVLAVIAVIALLAVAAYAIYRNWAAVSAWFARLWEAVKLYFHGFYEFLAGVFTGNMGRAKAGLVTMWEGLKAVFGVLWDGIKGTFLAFVAWLEGTWIGGAVTGAIKMFKDAWDGVTSFFTELVGKWAGPFNDFIENIEGKIKSLRNSGFGQALGLGTTPAAAPGASGGAEAPLPAGGARTGAFEGARAPSPFTGEIVVRAASGANVERATSNHAGVHLRRIDAGEMAGRD